VASCAAIWRARSSISVSNSPGRAARVLGDHLAMELGAERVEEDGDEALRAFGHRVQGDVVEGQQLEPADRVLHAAVEPVDALDDDHVDLIVPQELEHLLERLIDMRVFLQKSFRSRK